MLDHQVVTQGVTLGLYEILNAKKIIFLVNGADKKAVYQKLMKKEISTSLPASFLWLHDNVEMIVMREVAE
jgi:galactosamine-6-phosphate isomerase